MPLSTTNSGLVPTCSTLWPSPCSQSAPLSGSQSAPRCAEHLLPTCPYLLPDNPQPLSGPCTNAGPTTILPTATPLCVCYSSRFGPPIGPPPLIPTCTSSPLLWPPGLFPLSSTSVHPVHHMHPSGLAGFPLAAPSAAAPRPPALPPPRGCPAPCPTPTAGAGRW